MQRSLRSDVNYKRINKYCEGSSPTWKCQSLGVSVCRGTRNSGSFQSSHMKSLVQVSRGSLRTGPKIYTNCSSCTNRTKDSETETWYCDPNLAGSLGNPPSPWNTYSALGKKSPARCSSRWKSVILSTAIHCSYTTKNLSQISILTYSSPQNSSSRFNIRWPLLLNFYNLVNIYCLNFANFCIYS